MAVIQAAFEKAEAAPIPNTPAVRLAIGWLLLDGVAELHQAERFIDAMANPSKPYHGAQADYMRFTEMDQMLAAWRRELRRRDRDTALAE